MRTVQMTLDENLIRKVDKVVFQLKITRSAFTRDALRMALERLNTQALEQKHRAGYHKKPVAKNEFDVWENEQVWID